MQTRIQKWGNSLAVRIPKSFADEAGINQDGLVEMSLVDGVVTLKAVPPSPPARRAVSLEDLLARITPENLHGEVDMGPPIGKEIVEP